MRFHARLAAVFYLLTFVTGGIALSTSGDQILANPTAFGVNFTCNLLAGACYVAVTAIFYELFKPVNRTVSLSAAFFSLVGVAVGAASCAFELAARAAAKDMPALAVLFLKVQMQANDIGLVFFGFYCLLIGWLIYRSTFLPRAIGVLMVLAGLGWLTFLAPAFARHLAPWVMLPGIVGEAALTLWLLVFSVREA
ncbi:MAG: DUF4386 domain-containing protein [Myxococcales bacterium]|nr:DUF4386 domain-containing protein [Myxococcales bacterium]